MPHDSHLANPLERIDLSTALQYGTAEGYPPLASFIRTFALSYLNPNIPYKGGADIILTCGNTDGFAKTIECFTDPWSSTCGRPVSQRQGLLCEEFAYMNAIQTASPRGLNIVPVAVDAEGMLAYGAERCLYNVLSGWDVERDGGKRPHIMYTVTMGQNPTSGLLSVKRRKEIYGICQKFDVLIAEDDPYFYMQFPHVANELSQKWRNGDLTSVNHFAEAGTNYQTSLAVPVRGTVRGYDGQDYTTTRMKRGVSSGSEFLDSLVPSYLSLDVDGRVIRLDTFSKTVAPGCRMGWITAQPRFIEKLLRITEVSTQQPSGFAQSMVAELLIGPGHKEAYEAMRKGKKKDELPSNGWKMDGWIRWLEGLRGNYERRMRVMAEVLEGGKTIAVPKKSEKKVVTLPIKTNQASPNTRSTTTTKNTIITPSNWGTLSAAEDPDNDFEFLTPLKIFDFHIPMAGMFLWAHFNYPSHPLAHSSKFTLAQLSHAFWIFQTRKPYLILTGPGTLFAPTDAIKQERAWQYFRLSFAAAEEGEIRGLSERFVRAAHDFWDIDDEDVILELLDEGTEDHGQIVQNALGRGAVGWTPFMC